MYPSITDEVLPTPQPTDQQTITTSTEMTASVAILSLNITIGLLVSVGITVVMIFIVVGLVVYVSCKHTSRNVQKHLGELEDITYQGFIQKNIFGGEAASSANCGIAATYVSLPFPSLFLGGKLGY